MSTKANEAKDLSSQPQAFNLSKNDNHDELLATIKAVSQRQDFPIKHITIMLSLSFLLMFSTSFGILAFTTRGWFAGHSQPVMYSGTPNPFYEQAVKGSLINNPSATANAASHPGYAYPPQIPNSRSFTLDDVPTMPLTQISRNQVVALQWGSTGSGEERKYLLYVDGVSRDVGKQITSLAMSSGHVIVVHPDRAVLYDRNNEELGTLEFTADDQNEPHETDKDSLSASSKLRKLVRYGKEKHGGGDFFDGYCRYGCSQMGVTFPYYYRPFFGYGYPLVGTEGFFPAGYGGNPVTELAANGVMGPPGAGGLAGMPPMPQPAGAPGMTPGMAPF